MAGAWRWPLTPSLVPWSRKNRAIPLLLLWAVRAVQSLSVCTRVHFTFIHFKKFAFLNVCGCITRWCGAAPLEGICSDWKYGDSLYKFGQEVILIRTQHSCDIQCHLPSRLYVHRYRRSYCETWVLNKCIQTVQDIFRTGAKYSSRKRSSFYACSKICEVRLSASSCLSVCPHGTTVLPLWQHFVKFDICRFYKNPSKKFKFHQNVTTITGNHCLVIPRWILLKTRIVSGTSFRENQNIF